MRSVPPYLGALVALVLAVPVSMGQEGETPPDAPSSEAAPLLKVGKVRLFRKDGRVEIDGRIAVQKRAVELFACAEGGKVHETVLILDCKPSNLNLALLLLGLDDGGQVRDKVRVRVDGKEVEKEMLVENGPRYFGDPRKPHGDRLIARVRWQDGESRKIREVRAEEMVYNVSRQKTMRKVGWIFTGSRWVTNPNTGRKEFAADHSKTLMTTYHDPNTVLENPMKTGGNDEMYHANSLVVPPRGTPVTLVLTLPTEEEKAEALALEAESDEDEVEPTDGGPSDEERAARGG